MVIIPHGQGALFEGLVLPHERSASDRPSEIRLRDWEAEAEVVSALGVLTSEAAVVIGSGVNEQRALSEEETLTTWASDVDFIEELKRYSSTQAVHLDRALYAIASSNRNQREHDALLNDSAPVVRNNILNRLSGGKPELFEEVVERVGHRIKQADDELEKHIFDIYRGTLEGLSLEKQKVIIEGLQAKLREQYSDKTLRKQMRADIADILSEPRPVFR